MRVTKYRKRSRIIKILLLPAIALIWFVGWALYWIGGQKPRSHSSLKQDSVTLVASASLEEEEHVEARA